jgi:hypothetical protein
VIATPGTSISCPRWRVKKICKGEIISTFGGIAPVLGAWQVPHQTPVEGLWFLGVQSQSGGGVNNVMPAARRVAQQID